MPENPRVAGHCAAIELTYKTALRSIGNGFTPDQLVFRLPPSRSHIAWLMGHISFMLDATCVRAGGQAALDSDIVRQFGMGTLPESEANGYPPAEELFRMFDAAMTGLQATVAGLADTDLDRPLESSLAVAAIFPTIDALLHGVVFHTAYHAGQIAILRRAQGMPSAIGI